MNRDNDVGYEAAPFKDVRNGYTRNYREKRQPVEAEEQLKRPSVFLYAAKFIQAINPWAKKPEPQEKDDTHLFV